jgi:hypothetical protein
VRAFTSMATMRCLLSYRDTAIARVTLDVGEPSGGIVAPLPGYAAIAEVIRAACDLQWRAHRPPDLARPTGVQPGTLEAAAEVLAQLALTTETGTPVAAARLELWDAPVTSDPPFLLVWWGAAGAPVPAGVPTPPREGTDARLAA